VEFDERAVGRTPTGNLLCEAKQAERARLAGEHGEPGTSGVGLREQDRRPALARRLTGEREGDRRGARAADECTDGDERSTGLVEGQPARRRDVTAARSCSGRRAVRAVAPIA